MDGEDPGEGDEYGDENEQVEDKKTQEPNKKQTTSFQKQKTKQQAWEEEQLPKEKKPSVPRAPWRQKKEEKEKQAKADAPKPKKNNKILASMPANWEEEEKTFFEKEYDYDPQFQYDSPATNKRFLKMFPAPKYEYMP